MGKNNCRCLGAALSLLLIAVLTAGCAMPSKADDAQVESVLQLEHDILEDPLLKEMDALEASLLAEPPQETEPTADAGAAVQEPPASVSAAPVSATPAPAALPEPAAAAAAAEEAPASDTTEAKRVVFGQVRQADSAGMTLRVIVLKTLTAEEQKRIRNGEKVPRFALTDTVLKLVYSDKAVFEAVTELSPRAADKSEVASGQTVRVALNKAGKIVTVRILRE